MEILVPEEVLERLVAVDSQSDKCVRALAYFRFVDQYQVGAFEDVLKLTEVTRFYNRYYWFSVFADLRQRTEGPDAGIDQRKFQMLESAPAEVDWKVIEALDELTGQE